MNTKYRIFHSEKHKYSTYKYIWKKIAGLIGYLVILIFLMFDYEGSFGSTSWLTLTAIIIAAPLILLNFLVKHIMRVSQIFVIQGISSCVLFFPWVIGVFLGFIEKDKTFLIIQILLVLISIIWGSIRYRNIYLEITEAEKFNILNDTINLKEHYWDLQNDVVFKNPEVTNKREKRNKGIQWGLIIAGMILGRILSNYFGSSAAVYILLFFMTLPLFCIGDFVTPFVKIKYVHDLEAR